MPTPRDELVALLARVDQLTAAAYEAGDDETLDMRELFRIFDCLESLRDAQLRAERLLADTATIS